MSSAYALVTEHRPFVRASLRRLGVTGVPLDDAEQEVFLVVVRRHADFDPERGTSERGWIWGICRNVAAAHRRSNRRQARFEAVSDVGGRPPIEERITAAQALSVLDRESQALWLARCEGRSARELAEALELPLTTVQWRLRQAKRSLQQVLRGIARTGHAVVTWLLRPQHGFATLLAPALAVLALVPGPAEEIELSIDDVEPAAVPLRILRVIPHDARPASRAPSPMPAVVNGTVVDREPSVRHRRKVTGQVSLGDPSFE